MLAKGIESVRLGSIRSSLVWRQVVLILATVAVFALGFHGLVVRPAVTELVRKHFHAAAEESEVRLEQVFGFVEEALRIARERMRTSEIGIDDYRLYNERFIPLLRQNAWISSALYASDEGREILLLERANGAWSNRLTGLAQGQGRARLLDWQEAELMREEWRELGYDPRKRPWYQGALALKDEREVHWTPPYTFFTTGEPGITASLRWTGRDEHVRVLAFDVLLRDLSRLTASIEMGKRGFVAILTEDGRLLAAPEKPDGLKAGSMRRALMQPVAASGIGPLEEAFAAWKREGGGEEIIRHVEAGGEDWLARFKPYRLNGTNLWVASLVPEAEFSILQTGDLSILAGLGMLVLAGGIGVALSMSRRFSQPLEQLAAESERIGRLELDDGVPLKTGWREVKRLASAQSQMRRMLKGATQRLAESNEELERRVATRTQELERANHELESFSYSVSHDLRAPLRAINGFSHILEQDWGDRLDDEARNHLARIRLASEKMGNLIDGMLELARLARKEIQLTRVDLSEMAREVVEELRGPCPDREVRVDIAPGLVVEADATLMRNVLTNLLGNAWKYSGNAPLAEIAFGSELRHGETTYFVRDNGAGFDMQYADKLFQPFQRMHRDSEFAGTGLGLASVRRIVERHGGRVWAEAEPGRGATFYFTLGA